MRFTRLERWRLGRYTAALRRDCATPLPVQVRRRRLGTLKMVEEFGHKIDGFCTASRSGETIQIVIATDCALLRRRRDDAPRVGSRDGVAARRPLSALGQGLRRVLPMLRQGGGPAHRAGEAAGNVEPYLVILSRMLG